MMQCNLLSAMMHNLQCCRNTLHHTASRPLPCCSPKAARNFAASLALQNFASFMLHVTYERNVVGDTSGKCPAFNLKVCQTPGPAGTRGSTSYDTCAFVLAHDAVHTVICRVAQLAMLPQHLAPHCLSTSSSLLSLNQCSLEAARNFAATLALALQNFSSFMLHVTYERNVDGDTSAGLL